MEMVLRVMVVSVSHFAVCLNHKHVSSDHKDDLLQWINEIKLTDIPVQIAVYFNSHGEPALGVPAMCRATSDCRWSSGEVGGGEIGQFPHNNLVLQTCNAIYLCFHSRVSSYGREIDLIFGLDP